MTRTEKFGLLCLSASASWLVVVFLARAVGHVLRVPQ